ncbi:MAG: radical SAM protein [Candidatus Freyarchaeota archaeon]
MRRLSVPVPVSAGVLLSYRCSGECRHCMYGCSPAWSADWISERDMERVLTQLSRSILPSPFGRGGIGINYGLHFTGGEPFLNFDLLLRGVELASELGIPSLFVETNSFWCTSDRVVRERLGLLRDSGLDGVLVSVNPFILEQVSFERTMRAIRIAKEIFGENVIVYQKEFYHQFRDLGVKGTLSFEEYLRRVGLEGLRFVELLPMGRAAYSLGHLYRRYSAERFFGESCLESLTRNWHVHVDNYCNYMPGYCGGISLGDARNLDSICSGVDLEDHPILEALITDLEKLYALGVDEFGYCERREGYISKCHLCLDIRRHIVKQTDEFRELSPREFYIHI